MATLVQYYVNTDGANGDGSSGSPWSSMENARAGLAALYPSGLVTADVDVEIYFSGATQDTAPTTSTGVNWTIATDATHRIRLLPADASQRATMPFSTGRYRLVQTNGFRPCMTIATDFLEVGAIQIRNTGPRANSPTCIKIPSTAGRVTKIFGAYCDMTAVDTPGADCVCIDLTGAGTNHQLIVHNAVVAGARHGLRRTGTAAGALTQLSNITAVNNVSYGVTIAAASGTHRVRNLVAKGNGTADFQWSTTGGTLVTGGCRTADASSPDVAGRNAVFTFVNDAGGDWHLAAGDVGAKGQGVDLSADPTDPFAIDFDGAARPSGAWDAGADQVSGGGGSGPDEAIIILTGWTVGGTAASGGVRAGIGGGLIG